MVGGSRGMLAAHQPLVVPMLLRLSHFVLNGYVVLVVSKQKGITLVFKTDPLQNVDVNSTFDSIAVIQKYIQKEIEGQLREMFREDLPGIIHRLSQTWVAGKTKVETPYMPRQPVRTRAMSEQQETMSSPDLRSTIPVYAASLPGSRPPLRPPPSRMSSVNSLRMNNPPAPRSAPSVIGTPGELPPPATPSTPVYEPPTTFPELENFDPTYGLRPDDLPAKSGYSGFGRLFGAPKGLADLAEHPGEDDDDWDESDSYDIIDWEETVSLGPPPSDVSEESPEYETIPAVGGGTVTRPRIFHSQSSIRPPSETGPSGSERANSSFGRMSTTSLPPLRLNRYSGLSGYSTPSPFQEGPMSTFPVRPMARRGNTLPGLIHVATGSLPPEWNERPMSMDNGFASDISTTHGMESSMGDSQGTYASPSQPERHSRHRSLSTSTMRSIESTAGLSTSPNFKSSMDGNGNIVLRPGLNNTISQLSTLSHSYHTLSPYARSLEHFTVRSVPHRMSSSNTPMSSHPRKAKRKRIYRLGSKKPPDREVPTDLAELRRTSSSSPPPPSEFEASDVEHYFRVPQVQGQGSLRHRASFQSSS